MTFDQNLNKQSKNENDALSSGIDYHFSSEEIKELAVILRRNQGNLPDSLSAFANIVETYIYNTMSVSEVMNLFS